MQCVQVQWRCSISSVEHQAYAYLARLAPCAPALVDQAAAALILPPNNIELAGGVPEPRAPHPALESEVLHAGLLGTAKQQQLSTGRPIDAWLAGLFFWKGVTKVFPVTGNG